MSRIYDDGLRGWLGRPSGAERCGGCAAAVIGRHNIPDRYVRDELADRAHEADVTAAMERATSIGAPDTEELITAEDLEEDLIELEAAAIEAADAEEEATALGVAEDFEADVSMTLPEEVAERIMPELPSADVSTEGVMSIEVPDLTAMEPASIEIKHPACRTGLTDSPALEGRERTPLTETDDDGEDEGCIFPTCDCDGDRSVCGFRGP